MFFIIMEFFYSFLQQQAISFDNKCFYNKITNQNRAARFFYFASRITNFFFFSRLGMISMSIFLGLCFFFSHSYFKAVVIIFGELGTLQGIHFMVYNLSLSLILVFAIFLWDLTILNTFLVYCPSVSTRITFLYGEDFLKKRGYNSSLASIKVAGQMSKIIAVGVGAGIVGGAVTAVVDSTLYSDNYKYYVKSSIDNPGVVLKPPEKSALFGIKFGR